MGTDCSLVHKLKLVPEMIDWALSYQICSIVSVLASGIVVLTLVLFKSMRNKLFMRIIANISLADILGNIPYTTQYRPSDGSFWCSMQGFLNLYSYPCSWLWTTTLVLFLYDLSVHRKVRMTFRTAFIICWGVPIIITLLYFAFIPHRTYERHKGNNSQSFCIYGGNNKTGFIWHVISYYGLFIMCVIYMAHLYVYIRRAVRQEQRNIAASAHGQGRESGVSTTSSVTLNSLRLTSDSLMLNPIIMITLWTPHIIAVILSISMRENNARNDFDNVALNLKIFHGFCTAVLFFAKSHSARNLWMRLLCCKYTLNQVITDDLAEEEEEDAARQTETSISDYRVSDQEMRVTSHSISSLAVANPLGRMAGNAEL
jgi:hypothetical protein